MDNNDTGNIYEFNGDTVHIREDNIEPYKGRKKKTKNLILSPIILSMGLSYVLVKEPCIIPKVVDTVYYKAWNSIKLEDAIKSNNSIEDNTKEKIIKYVSKFINDYKEYIDYDLICSVFNNLRIIYENENNYTSNELVKGFYNEFNIIEAPYNTIIMFEHDNDILAHELFHVISRYSNFELKEGMTELLRCEVNNMNSNSYGPMIFHIKMLSNIIDKDNMIKDYLGYTTNSTKKALLNTGAFPSLVEVEMFIDAIKDETLAINDFVDGRKVSDLERIIYSEKIIVDGYNRIFNTLNIKYPEYYNYYELLVDNYSKEEGIKSLFLYMDNTNIYYDNGSTTDITLKRVSNKEYKRMK